MRTFVAVIKLILFVLTTLLCYLLGIVGVVLSVFGFDDRVWATYFLQLWGKSTCYILGIKVKIEGNPPKPPFFLVANHLSYVDVMVLLSTVRGVFVAKSEVSSWPLFGFMTRTLGMIFINRAKRTDVRRVNNLIAKNITPSQGVLVFPESTTSEGTRVLPFKSSLLAYPAQINMPVHYAILHYSTPEDELHACDSICWWGDIPFFTHFVRLLKIKGGDATVTFGKDPIIESDRKQLSDKLYQSVNSQFKKVISISEFEERVKNLEKV